MILLERTEGHPKLVLMFGIGLIGTSILRMLTARESFVLRELPFCWLDRQTRLRDRDAIVAYIGAIASRHRNARQGDCTPRVDFLWSAGVGGFGMNQSDAAWELQAFKDVVGLAVAVKTAFPRSELAFHMLSSAGGLFEEQRDVGPQTTPRPQRPYGALKWEQEGYLCQHRSHLIPVIYRPSSVYGYVGRGRRLGLVPTLLDNGLRYRVSRISGAMHTLRDYVFLDDIGSFMATSILTLDNEPRTLLLASGKPTTITEILFQVERLINRRLFVSHDTSRGNAASMSFQPSGLPGHWIPTDIATGIRRTYLSLQQDI
jgi:nucleoside-diphosphate-sugar epimerase